MTDVSKEFRVAQVILNSLEELPSITSRIRVHQYVEGHLREVAEAAAMSQYLQFDGVPEEQVPVGPGAAFQADDDLPTNDPEE